MATNLNITDSAYKSTGPACNDAPCCCWYETSGETEGDCTNRNNIVCQLRREEVFNGSAPSPRSDMKLLVRARV
jgi:hypothetical protein